MDLTLSFIHNKHVHIFNDFFDTKFKMSVHMNVFLHARAYDDSIII